MNIFVVDEDPRQAARDLCDRHVVKMSLESVQLLCTAVASIDLPTPYRPTHQHHPCARWVLGGWDNLDWLLAHTEELHAEYTRRYGRIHASSRALQSLCSGLIALGRRLPPGGTRHPQAMPEQYRGPCTVQAYRAYYRGEKSKMARWTPPGSVPAWW